MPRPVDPSSDQPRPAKDPFPARNYTARTKSPRGPTRSSTPTQRPQIATAWEKPAEWYDQHQGEAGDDFYQRLILPTVLRRLDATAGQRVLDLGCGQGVLGRTLARAEVRSLGVDASPSLVQAARLRAGGHEAYVVGDVRDLPRFVSDRSFDHAAAVMALQDVDRIDSALAGAAQLVKPGGRLVVVLSHPCLRIPKSSSWGWDETAGVQYRRLDSYLSPFQVPIAIHPGDPTDRTRTTSFHRPLAAYLNALGTAGWAVIASDELCSHRRGTRGKRSAAEDFAATEFPLFLALTAVRLG